MGLEATGSNDHACLLGAAASPRAALPQRITVLVVTEIVAVRLVSAWTNPVLKRVPGVPVLKRVPGVAQVLAVACGLAYRLGVKTKARWCFVE